MKSVLENHRDSETTEEFTEKVTRWRLWNCALLKQILADARACQRFLKNNAVGVCRLATHPWLPSFGFCVPPHWWGELCGDHSGLSAVKNFFTGLLVFLEGGFCSVHTELPRLSALYRNNP